MENVAHVFMVRFLTAAKGLVGFLCRKRVPFVWDTDRVVCPRVLTASHVSIAVTVTNAFMVCC